MRSAKPSVFAAAILLLLPPPVVGQRIPASPGLIAHEATAPSPAPVWESARLPLVSPAGDPLAISGVSPSAQPSPLTMEEKSLKKRMLPYALAGLIAGGLLGYAAHQEVFWKRDKEACDLGDISVCPYTPYAYVLVGAGLGFWTGAGIGYLIERR